ncbi:hypothetical protein [Micromonospora sp. MW-13]|nr:hypothetical protein [Micromonospora sp. MW-13]
MSQRKRTTSSRPTPRGGAPLLTGGQTLGRLQRRQLGWWRG